jgi:hypothetical protein
MKQRTTPIGDILKSARAAIEQADSERVKKTALQQAFSLLQQLHPYLFDVHSETGRNFVNTFHQFLDIEKQQIMDAWKDGEMYNDEPSDFYAEQYYNQTFKQ